MFACKAILIFLEQAAGSNCTALTGPDGFCSDTPCVNGVCPEFDPNSGLPPKESVALPIDFGYVQPAFDDGLEGANLILIKCRIRRPCDAGCIDNTERLLSMQNPLIQSMVFKNCMRMRFCLFARWHDVMA